MFHNTNRTKYNKKFKIQTLQNTKEQNTSCQNTIATKYKGNKIQIEQNANIPKYKRTKYKTDDQELVYISHHIVLMLHMAIHFAAPWFFLECLYAVSGENIRVMCMHSFSYLYQNQCII